MQVAVCIQNKTTAAQLSQLFEQYERQRGNVLSCRFFHTGVSFLHAFVPGEYDSIFFGSEENLTLIREVQERDGGVQLVRIFPAQANCAPEDGILCTYLPEPVSALFLFPVLDKLSEEQKRMRETKLLVKNRGSIMYIPMSQIEYVEVSRRVILLHLTSGQTEEATGNFSDYEERLLHWPDFVKVHRSYVVNLRWVEKLTSYSLLMHSGRAVPVSKLLYPQFKKNYLGGKTSTGQKHVPPTDTSQDNSLRTHRILLVDDEQSERERWSLALSQLGCTVCTADSGDNALELCEKNFFDCVLLDVQLGSSSGYDLCQCLGEQTGAPVLYLSSLTDTEHQKQGFLTGGADYITKDTPPDLLFLKIQRRIASANDAKPELVSGCLQLDLRKRRAFLKGQALSLTAVEFDILHLLMQNPNETYTPERLYHLIWGTRQWDDGHTVQMHMTVLCNKLEQWYPKHCFVDSTWGEGYRFLSEETK